MSETERSRTFSRILEMITLISQNPRQFTAKALAQRLGVSKRSIHRYVRTVEDANLRIESCVTGGYFIQRDTSMFPTTLRHDEEFAIALVMWMVREISSYENIGALGKTFSMAMDKLVSASRIPEQQAMTLSKFKERIISNWAATQANVGAHVAGNDPLLEIMECIQSNLTVEVEYYSNYSSETTVRMLDPYYLVPFENSLYIIGFCHLREDYRTFKVSRIHNAYRTNRHFVLEDFSISEFLGESWGIDQSGEPIVAELVFRAQLVPYVLEEIPSRNLIQSSVASDGRMKVTLMARNNAEFQRFVMQFGAGVEVRGPSDLCSIVREQAEKIIAQDVTE